jgi:hypothetical protein
MRKSSLSLFLSMILVLTLWGGVFPNTNVWAANSPAKTIEIDSVDYMIENINPLYWQDVSNLKVPRIFITFYIYINNLENCIDTIKKVEVYDSSDKPWIMDLKKNTDASMRYIGGGTRFFDTTLSLTGSVLFLNNYQVVITTKDNEKIIKPFTICEPGQKEGSTKRFLFSADYRGQKDDSYVEALRWGKISSAAYQNGTFDVDFTINDERTSNARMEFYDQKKNYLGATPWFVNSFSKETIDSLNNGGKLHTEGQMNHLQIMNNEIMVNKSKKISKTKYVVLITKDGNQYGDSDNPDNFNHNSCSEPCEVKN